MVLDILTIIIFVILVYLLTEEFGMINNGGASIVITLLAMAAIAYPIMLTYMEDASINRNWIKIIATGARNFMVAIFILIALIALINYIECLTDKLFKKNIK